ncbi:transcriptional regulator, TetR family [Streptosporangium subroseum]|uniref:Transcriptional regulator, TetR family n=1 Tax=Streptosporangium subroseum TaxID=106412 RepID=A0A239MXY4_9ACTN|nr:TetR/AcrR family transcriptional regulator C-terminal domain-containing protein [Streptosporangium subroseum]SNT47495.1 transcriptional regulator, TetR family [Streptosporangium subroseum]
MAKSKRVGLTRQMMIETALRLLDEVGLDGLTVRRLATELGVQSPALYWHLRNKQELLDGMADAIVVAAGMGPPRDGESWQDWLARRARAYRESLLAHRDGARIVANAARLSPATLRTFDEELTAMVGHGFTPLLALRTITALTHYTNGAVLQEQATRQERIEGQESADGPADRTEGQESADGPQDRIAALAEMLDGGMEATLLVAFREGGGSFGEETFEYGLRALIDGTAAALALQRPGRPA